MTQLLAVETALPTHTLDRAETRTLLPALAGGEARASRFREVVERSRIAQRHLPFPAARLFDLGSAEQRAAAYSRHAHELAEPVARRALSVARVDPASLDTIISVSCTGYALPSLDVDLFPKLGLNLAARRLPITELGCSAGVAAVGVTAELLARKRSATALIVGVELCSLCIETTAPTDADVIGSILFGDAAAAIVMRGDETGEGPEVVASQTALWPETRSMLGMRVSNRGLRLVLSPELPNVVRRHLLPTVDRFLTVQRVAKQDLGFWIVHPGGPKVLEAVGETLGLGDPFLRPSWEVWERCGNVSSMTVFFILRALQESAPPPEGAVGMMLAFGPGLSCEMVLLRARGWLSRRR